MQILSVHLRNIKSHHDTELSFSSGINVLSGANGAGKSTVFEAIGYAMFGVDARDFVSNADRFLTIGSKKGEISVTFRADDGETYRVSRTVGAAAKWLLAREIDGGFEVEDHARAEETEQRVAGILGLANGRPLAEQFRLVIGPFQNDFLGPFVIKQPTKRQEAFDEILGIDAWRKTYRGTAGLQSALQERIKVLEAELRGKQEQLAVLPDRTAELAAVQTGLSLRKKEQKAKAKELVTLNALLVTLEAQEKAVIARTNEIRLLENRMKDGAGKIDEQKQWVVESRAALKIVEDSKAGKEAFDKVETGLAGLRRQEQQRRVVEQDIRRLEKEALRLSQQQSHESAEIEKTVRQLAVEQDGIDTDRKGLLPDVQISAAAARLPAIKKETDTLKGQRALLDGRRESLLEGRDKLAEGNCPFFQEPCRNIAGSLPRDVFSSRIRDLESQAAEYDRQLGLLALQLKDAEAADRELSSRAVRLQELDKQAAGLAARRGKNNERSAALQALAKQQTDAAALVKARTLDLKAFAGLDDAIAGAEKKRLQLQPARDAYTANLNVALELEARLLQLDRMERLLEELSATLKTVRTDLDALNSGFNPELLQKARQDRDQLLAETAALEQQMLELGRNSERLTAEIADLHRITAEAAARQADIDSGRKQEKLVKFLRNQIFKNVSTQLSERFREEISLRADLIYRTIAGSDEELYWGDNYQIILKDMADGVMRERSDDQLSGGQMMSAVVALRLALLQTIGARIAFFDEPTSNLDAARRENLAHAFRAIDVGREEVTTHWYDQLFLVSHDVAFTEITDKVIEL